MRNIIIDCPLKGKLFALNEIGENIDGRGVDVGNPAGAIFSPFQAEVNFISTNGNAIGLKSDEGIELFINVGIGTDKLDAKYFDVWVEVNEVVKRGDLLMKFDVKGIERAGCSATTSIVVMNDKDFGDITFALGNEQVTIPPRVAEENDSGMEGRKFTILGETGSGKTCYLLGMYYEMSMSVAGYTVVATNPDDDRNLTLRYKMLLDKSRGQGRFPAGTDSVQKFNFNLQYNYETIHPFQWVDYPGGFLDTTTRDDSSEQYKEVEQSIKESEMLFICIDGANLVGSSTQKKIRKVKTRCAKNINPYLVELRNKLKAEGKGLPPIGMLITKYDICAEDTDEEELREIVEEAFEGLFGGEDTFIAVIPVSLGDTLQDDDYQGDLDPINIHLPILMGINFALIDQLELGKSYIENQRQELDWNRRQKRIEDKRWGITRWFFGGYDPDYLQENISELEDLINSNRQVVAFFKKSLKRMNRELEAIDMIYTKGAWQDKRGIKEMWAEIQSIADYNF